MFFRLYLLFIATVPGLLFFSLDPKASVIYKALFIATCLFLFLGNFFDKILFGVHNPLFRFGQGSLPLVFNSKHFFWIPICLYSIGFLFHYFYLTKNFSANFQFWDLDYIGLSDVVHHLAIGEGAKSNFYEEGKSYFGHHFALNLILFTPFDFLPWGRWNFAIGVAFFYILGIISWSILFISKNRYVSFTILLCSLYSYRLGISYHFEAIVLPCSALFFWIWFVKEKTNWIEKIFSFLIFCFCKEDIALYLMVLGSLLWILERNKYTGKMLTFYSLAYFVFSQIVMQMQSEHFGFFFWVLEWNKSYEQSGFATRSLGDRLFTFLELQFSFAFFFFRSNPFALSFVIIAILHLISGRPWYNSLYSYYSYSILPFGLMGLFFLEKETKPATLLLFFLAFVLYRNSLDKEFPRKVSPSLDFPAVEWIDTGKAPVFLQPNMAIFTRPSMNLFPLRKLGCQFPGKNFAIVSWEQWPNVFFPENSERELRSQINHFHGKIEQEKTYFGKRISLYSWICPTN